MTETYSVITTDPESKYVFEPGTLYFADFRLTTPIPFYDDKSVIAQFEENMKNTIRIAGEQVGENIEIDSVIANSTMSSIPGDIKLHITGTLDPSEWSTVIDEPVIYSFRVYFRTHTPPIIIFIGIVAVALALAVLATTTGPILERICKASENVAVTIGDVAKVGLKTPEAAIKMVGAYAIPLAIAFASFGIFILGWGRK